MENIVKFEATVLFEATIDTCGSCYLVIYGRHVNGYFCAIPNFGISCEMAEPNDTFYNMERLRDHQWQGKIYFGNSIVRAGRGIKKDRSGGARMRGEKDDGASEDRGDA